MFYFGNLYVLFMMCLMDFVLNWNILHSNFKNWITSYIMESWWELSKAFAVTELIFVIQQMSIFHAGQYWVGSVPVTLGPSAAEDRSPIRFKAEVSVLIIWFSTLRWRHIGNKSNLYRMFLSPCFLCSCLMCDHKY